MFMLYRVPRSNVATWGYRATHMNKVKEGNRGISDVARKYARGAKSEGLCHSWRRKSHNGVIIIINIINIFNVA